MISLDQIDAPKYLPSVRSTFLSASQNLDELIRLIDKTSLACELIPLLLGHQQSATTLLVVNDQRLTQPLGGSPEMIIALEFLGGEMQSISVIDIEELDLSGQTRYKWDYDWSKNAEIIINQLGKKSKYQNLTQASAVIAVSIDALLDIQDQVMGNEIGKQVKHQEILKNFDRQGNSRKIYFNDLINEIWQNATRLDIGNLRSQIDLESEHLSQKKIMLYFRDQSMLDRVREKGWAGKFEKSVLDNIAVTISSMDNNASDTKIAQSLIYELDEDVNGLFAKLRVSLSGQGLRTTPLYIKTLLNPPAPLGSVGPS